MKIRHITRIYGTFYNGMSNHMQPSVLFTLMSRAYVIGIGTVGIERAHIDQSVRETRGPLFKASDSILLATGSRAADSTSRL